MFVRVTSGILYVWFKKKLLGNGEYGGGEDVNFNQTQAQPELNQEDCILSTYPILLTHCGYCRQKGGRYV